MICDLAFRSGEGEVDGLRCEPRDFGLRGAFAGEAECDLDFLELRDFAFCRGSGECDGEQELEESRPRRRVLLN